jgi:hypothetical protein
MCELNRGERLQTAHGPLSIKKIELRRRSVRVYNIEVAGEHVYEVTQHGVLVHILVINCVRLPRRWMLMN